MKKNNNKAAMYALAILFTIIFLLPVIYVILNAFKTSGELFSGEPTFFPKDWTLDNFRTAISQGNFLIYIKNSLIVAVVSTIIMVMLNTMAGYALAKKVNSRFVQNLNFHYE